MRATCEPVEGNKVRLSVEIDEPEVDKVLDADGARPVAPGPHPGLPSGQGAAPGARGPHGRRRRPAGRGPARGPAGLLRPGRGRRRGRPDRLARDRHHRRGGGRRRRLRRRRRGPPGRSPSPATPGFGSPCPRPTSPTTRWTAQIDRLRETEAELVEVGRPAADGDNVTIDLHGDRPPAARRSWRSTTSSTRSAAAGSCPSSTTQLRGAKAGDILGVRRPPRPGGEPVTFRVLVKDVKEKKLPEAHRRVGGRDLRVRDRRGPARRSARPHRQGEAGPGPAGAARERRSGPWSSWSTTTRCPRSLVDEEVRQRVHDLGHRLERAAHHPRPVPRGHRANRARSCWTRSGSRRAGAVKADLALRALAEAEELDVDRRGPRRRVVGHGRAAWSIDVRRPARRSLDRGGRTAAVRSEQRKAKALTWLLDHVELVDDQGNPVSRDELAGDQGDEAKDAATAEGSGGRPPRTTGRDAHDGEDRGRGHEP